MMLETGGRRSTTAQVFGLSAVWALLVFAIYAVLISWLDPAIPWPLVLEWEPWRIATLNVLPAMLLTLLLIAITRRTLLASWLTILTLGALYAINTHKLEQLATPLLPDDLRFLQALGVDFSLFGHYLALDHASLLLAAGAALTTLLLCREPVVAKLSGWHRVAMGLTVLCIGVSLAHGAAPWTRVYDAGRLQFEPWAPVESSMRTGLLTNLILFSWELTSPRIPPPDVSAATRLLRELRGMAPVRAGSASALPDIIVLQSESLFDPGRLAGAPDGAYLSNYRRLAQRGWSGELQVPTYGGGTIRTEFEVLTGLALEAFPRVRYPYLELTRREMPGLVHALARHGYRTTAIHPNSGAFWNRRQAFRSMGFDRFVDGGEFPAGSRRSWYISDAALTDRILGELADEGAPQFVLAVSIQNHGPYRHRPGIDAKRIAGTRLPAGLAADGEEELGNYLALLDETDEELGRLAEALMRRGRPTLLLFYGDHLPSLNAAFSQIGFADGVTPQEQPVPWLLLDNRVEASRSENISAWLLPSLLLSVAGLDGGRYFDILEALRERWDLEGIGRDEQRSGLAAITQLEYVGALESVMEADEAVL